MANKVVNFNGIKWYIIADDSTAADAGTVTLLAADTSFGTCAFNDIASSSYSYSTVKKRLDELTETGSFKSMAKSIADTDLTDVSVTKAKLFLLSYGEAVALPDEVKKIDFTGGSCTKGEWWTRSTDTSPGRVLYLEGVRDGSGGSGNIDYSSNIANAYGVRPALRLDLSKVSFSVVTREFSLDTAKLPYFNIVNTTTTVSFNNCDWYVIADDSTAVDAGTVTLLAAGTEFGRSEFSSVGNSYNNSDVKGYLEQIVSGTAGEGKPDFNGVAAAIQKVTLTTYTYDSTAVSETTNDAQMFLLSTEEANALPEEIRKSGFTDGWWLRSPGSFVDWAAYVYGNGRHVDVGGTVVGKAYGVRPALKLNLSSVIFSSGSNTFSLKTSHEKKEEEKKEDAKKEITVFDNEPLAYSEETKGDFRIGYCHEIPFAGKGKLTVESFGENFTVLQGNESYKVKKIKANKKKHRIQILKLENAPKDVEKDVKKATKGDNGIPYTQNPYYVRDTDKVTPKFKKSGAAASVKVNINGKDYKAKKTEYDYNEASKLIIFKGDNLAGSWAVK